MLLFLQDHCCVLNSIVGWDSTIGKWARVEGTPSDPNPNDPYAKIDSETLFRDGKLTPSITILGKHALTVIETFIPLIIFEYSLCAALLNYSSVIVSI